MTRGTLRAGTPWMMMYTMPRESGLLTLRPSNRVPAPSTRSSTPAVVAMPRIFPASRISVGTRHGVVVHDPHGGKPGRLRPLRRGGR